MKVEERLRIWAKQTAETVKRIPELGEEQIYMSFKHVYNLGFLHCELTQEGQASAPKGDK